MQIGFKFPTLPDRSKLILIGLSLLEWLVVTLLIFSPYIPTRIHWRAGDSASRTILAPQDIRYESQSDHQKNLQVRQEHADKIDKVYVVDQDINKEVISRVRYLFSVVQSDAPDREDVLAFLTPGQRQLLMQMDAPSLESLKIYTLDQTENVLDQGIQEVDPEEIRAKLSAKNQVVNVHPAVNAVVQSILLAYLQPNLAYDPIRTQELIETELSSITPFTTEIKRGTPILYEGQIVTADHLSLLKRLNIYGLETNFSRLAGIGIVVALSLLLLERFFYYFTPPVYQRKRYLILTHVLIIFTLVSARVLQLLPEFKWVGSLLFLVPVPVIAIILGLTVSRHVAVVVSSVVSILVAMMLRLDTGILIYMFLLGCGTTFTIDRTLKRSELIRSGYIIGLIAMVITIGVALIKDQTGALWYATNLGVSFLNGVVSTMISLATLPYIEQLFKITTSQTLLEYSNLNHPLMKQLMMSAPGTYQHSLMVSNLAEAAAEAIGADPVLARTGAYFHDIGKIKRPAFFSENQFSGENPHQALSPRMSKLIIASHVKEGAQLAEKYKLPDSLRDFILEHHGTSLVSYFFSKALRSEGEASSVQEEDFRYPGPRPQTKESGVLMLADSVEASVRSLEKPTLQKIEDMVETIFKEKIEDHQLDDCLLSLKEIDRIKQTFLTIFRGMYHHRVNYQNEIQQLKTHFEPENVHERHP